MNFESDEFDIIRSVGHGATAEVFLAKNLSTQRDVALKVFSEKLIRDQDFQDRLRSEADVLGRLKHPNIVYLYRQLEASKNFALEMEFIDGCDLGKFAQQYNLPLLEPLLWILVQVAEGLGGAHEQFVLHRDLKPENVLVSRAGEVKISDFGLARSMDRRTITRSGMFLGSLGYMAPEVIAGEKATPRSDLFSWGVMAFELLTGDTPFAGQTPQAVIKAVTEGKFQSLRLKAPHLKPRVVQIIDQCLNVDPNLRPQSVWHVRAELMMELTESGILHLCRKLVSEASSQVLGKAFQLKHQSLCAQLTNIKNLSDDQKTISAKAELVSVGGELQRLFPDDHENLNLFKELLRELNNKTHARRHRSMPVILFAVLGVGFILSFVAWRFHQSPERDIAIASVAATLSSKENALIPSSESATVNAAESVNTANTLPPAAEKITTPKLPSESEPPSQFGTIKFDVDSDVEVFVDDKRVAGKSLKSLRLLAGTHRLRLSKMGFDPIENQITVKAGQSSTIRARDKGSAP